MFRLLRLKQTFTAPFSDGLMLSFLFSTLVIVIFYYILGLSQVHYLHLSLPYLQPLGKNCSFFRTFGLGGDFVAPQCDFWDPRWEEQIHPHQTSPFKGEGLLIQNHTESRKTERSRFRLGYQAKLNGFLLGAAAPQSEPDHAASN
jgi:hypothetical protein